MLEHIDHVNIVVADMPLMIAFYRDVLGMRLAREVTISGDWIDDVTGLKNAKADVAFMEAVGGPTIELLYYQTPPGTRPDGLEVPNTFGLRHIAFRVKDIDKVVSALLAAGAVVLSDIHSVPIKQVAFGQAQKRLVYFRDPEGNLLELCEYA